MDAATLIYAVHWPSEGVLKIGRAGHLARVRKHMATGGVPVLLLEHRARADECVALAAVRHLPPAFTEWREARRILGPRGSGYSECFAVDTVNVPETLDLVRRSLENHG